MKVFAKKIGTTQYYDDDNILRVATVLELLKTVIGKTEKNQDKFVSYFVYDDGKSIPNKPLKGQFKGIENIKKVATQSYEEDPGYKDKQEVKITDFEENEKISIVSRTKGKGFAGTVKRHGFNTGPKTHGSRNYRRPGSIGDTGPQRVVKGKKMAGHMGDQKKTLNNVKIIRIEPKENRLWLGGHIPGPNKSIIEIAK